MILKRIIKILAKTVVNFTEISNFPKSYKLSFGGTLAPVQYTKVLVHNRGCKAQQMGDVLTLLLTPVNNFKLKRGLHCARARYLNPFRIVVLMYCTLTHSAL